MGGKWNVNPFPIRPGSYINYESTGDSGVEPGAFGRVGMPIRANWGPAGSEIVDGVVVKNFVDCVTDADRTAAFGATDGTTAIVGAPDTSDTSWLIREAISGGAALVRAYRMIGGDATKATCVVPDSLGVSVLHVEALYYGSRANGFSIRVIASPVYGGKSELQVVETVGAKTSILERWVHSPDDIPTLVNLINGTTPNSTKPGSRVIRVSQVSSAAEQDETATLLAGTPAPSAGTFDVLVNIGDAAGTVVTASGIAATATQSAIALAVQSAVAGVVIGATVTGGGSADLLTIGNAVTLTFGGTLGNQNVGVTVDTTGLTGVLTVPTDVRSLADLASGVIPPTAGNFRLAMSINGNPATAGTTTADIAHTAGDTAVAAAITALGGSFVGTTASVLSGGPGLDTASTVIRIAFDGLLANSVVTVAILPALVGALTPSGSLGVTAQAGTGGSRSPLGYTTVGIPMGVASGGLNGTSGTIGAGFSDYVAAMADFEAEGGFDLFTLDGVTEEDHTGLNAAVKVWAETNNDAGRYMMVVLGGGSVELSNADITNALSRSALLDSEFIVNVGVSGLNVTSSSGRVLQLTSGQSAPRVAGLIAASGVTGSVTFADTGAVGINGPLSPTSIEALLQPNLGQPGGVVVFTKRGDSVRIEDGVTSFVTLTEEKDFTFTQIRAVRAIQQIGMDISEIVEADWIGKKVNTFSVQQALIARLQTYFAVLEAQNVLVNGTQVQIDTRYDNTTTNVFILVLAQFQFELKRVLLTVRVPTVS